MAVVVPAHRPSPAFDRCLQAIGRLDPQPDELIVVVDGGDAEVVARAEAAGARAVSQHPRSGPAVARNSGVARSSSDVVLFLDSDVEAAPDAVGRDADAFAFDPGLAAVIGSYDDAPTEANFASQYKNLLNHRVHQHAREEGFTFWGACGAIRRSAFLELGGFDEEYVAPSIEDIELGYRLREAGMRIRVDKGLQVTHLKRWTAGSLLKTDVVHRTLPWSALILRTGRMENDLNVDVAERVKSALTLLAVAALAVTFRWREAGLVALAAVSVVVVLDLPFLRFLAQRRGTGLALWGAGWHLLYHLYAAVGYLVALTRHLVFGAHALHEPWPGSPRRWHGDGPAPVVVSSSPTADLVAAEAGTGASAGGASSHRGGVDLVTRDPLTARIEVRVSHAASAVPTQRLLRQSRRLRLWVPLALLLLGGLVLLPHYRNAIHVDGLAYLRVAEEYAAGDLARAVNAYWGPLYSWLLVPFLWAGVEPLLATKLLQLGVGGATLLAVRRLCLVCDVRTATADGMALAAIPLVLYFVYLNVFADLLLALLLVLFCCELVSVERGDRGRRARRASLAGLWGGLAFLAKPYALPVVVVSVVLVRAVRARASRHDASPRAVVSEALRLGGVTLGTAAVVIAPWIAVLSVETGNVPVSHSVGYNLAILAPGSAGQPLANGLVDPPHADALFAWEDPSTMPVVSERWRSADEAAPRLVANLADNLEEGVVVTARQFLPVVVLAALGGWWMRRNTKGDCLRSPWAALLVVVAVYTGGYLFTLVEGRYLWFVVLALVPLAASAIDAPFLRPSLTQQDADFSTWRLVGFVLRRDRSRASSSTWPSKGSASSGKVQNPTAAPAANTAGAHRSSPSSHRTAATNAAVMASSASPYPRAWLVRSTKGGRLVKTTAATSPATAPWRLHSQAVAPAVAASAGSTLHARYTTSASGSTWTVSQASKLNSTWSFGL